MLTRQRAKNDLSARIERRFAPASEERTFAGLIGGVLYLLGALTLPLFTVLSGVTHAHSAQILALSAVTLTWGLFSALVIPWHRLAWWWSHVFTIVGLVVIALASAASGGAQSPAWVYLFVIVFYGAYFFPPAAAAACFAAAVLTQALPLFYDGRASHGLFLAQLAVGMWCLAPSSREPPAVYREQGRPPVLRNTSGPSCSISERGSPSPGAWSHAGSLP